jgi:hypothetical protein
MIAHEFREFVDNVMDRHEICAEDVKKLQREILQDVVMTRDVIDVLVALERAVAKSCSEFADYLVALAVDYAVWESRPTGVIDRDKAHWLVTTLGAGEGPTDTARRIAFEIVREAERCDEALLAFAMQRPTHRPRVQRQERMLLAS